MNLDKLHAAAITIGIAVAGIALREHDAKVKEVAIETAVQQAQAQYQKQIAAEMDDLRKQLADREAIYQKQSAALQSKLGQAATPKQLAALSNELMGLKTPIRIETPAPTPQNPNPVPIAEISLADAPQVKAYIGECEACKLELPKVKADLAGREAEIALADKQIESLKTERDAAVTAAKGGSIWHRTVRALKYLGIGALVGAGAICGSGHCK